MRRIEVTLPARINFGGAWSDTPPFCINEGGCVCNAAILINNKKPIKVSIEEITEEVIIIENEGEKIEISKLEKLEEIDREEAFALIKIILDLAKINKLNFKILIENENIPRGSGLGTSSILSLAILKAIYRFENRKIDDEKLINQVLEVEKRIGTGGGWQDQAGAIKRGIKLIKSNPGETQKLIIDEVKIMEETKKELKERLVLIYTGETRNSKDIVQEIMAEYQNDSLEIKEKINKLKEIAINMKEVLENGQIDIFAELLNQNYEISRTLNDKIVNKTTEKIFELIDDLISRKNDMWSW